jgi:hypothetical protein
MCCPVRVETDERGATVEQKSMKIGKASEMIAQRRMKLRPFLCEQFLNYFNLNNKIM